MAIRTIRRAGGPFVLATTVVLAQAALVDARHKPSTGGYVVQRQSAPSRTTVFSSTGSWLATFTDGSRTVVLRGPARTFAEPSATPAVVTSSDWVRLLASPFGGTVDTAWLTARLADTSPDVLAVAMRYIAGAPSSYTSAGLRYEGDASYGPIGADGTRQPGADFNDYLGTAVTYPSGAVDYPEADEYASLDCSGYVRMLFGYRFGLAMSLSPDGGRSLPRRSWEIAASSPGIVVLADAGAPPSSRAKLQAGDLVFFDATSTDTTGIDHVGMYLGRDSAGHDRFISSRKTANGPTLGDLGGASILDGTGYWASAFRSARRL